MPLIKKRLKPKTVERAKSSDHIRRNRARLNKVVLDETTGDLVKQKSRWFGRGDVKKVWDPKTGIRKKVTVTDSQGNLVTEVEYTSRGNRKAHAFKKK